jgi:hypothetical protein
MVLLIPVSFFLRQRSQIEKRGGTEQSVELNRAPIRGFGQMVDVCWELQTRDAHEDNRSNLRQPTDSSSDVIVKVFMVSGYDVDDGLVSKKSKAVSCQAEMSRAPCFHSAVVDRVFLNEDSPN